jgi:hypothetical protein
MASATLMKRLAKRVSRMGSGPFEEDILGEGETEGMVELSRVEPSDLIPRRWIRD